MIWYFTPSDEGGSLAKAYDKYAALVTDQNDWMVFQDRDVMYLTPDYFKIIKETIKENPKVSLFTCITNRVGNVLQQYNGECSDNPDMLYHEEIASKVAKENRTQVVLTNHVISGMVMIIQKKVWDLIGGAGNRPGILGVDNAISRKIINAGMKVGIMQGLYVLHYYRLKTGRHDKTHLLRA